MSTTLIWTNPAGGDFNTPGNWTPAQSPGTADNVEFQVSTLTSGNYFPYTYTVTGNATVATIIDAGDDVTFTGTLTSTATSSEDDALAVDEGTMTIAAGAAFTLSFPLSGNVVVGFNPTAGFASSIYANAQLTIAGSFTTYNLEVGEGTGNDFAATLLVTGSAARLNVNSAFLPPQGFSIGEEGTLEIENGATVESTGPSVGSYIEGGATALLTGPGSTWNIGTSTIVGLNTLSVGYDDTNNLTPSVLTVSNGASLTSTGGAFLFGQYGTLVLDDSVVLAGTIELDGGEIATLAVAGQALPQTITLGNTISIDASADSTLLASAQVGFDITGPLEGGGTLTIGPGGTVEIAGATSGFTGSVVIDDAAVLRLDSATALGTGPITFQTETGDTLDNAGTLLLAGGQTLTNALSLASGIGVLQIGHGDTFTLDNSVAGAGTLALAGGTFVLTDPTAELPSGGLVLQAATVVLDGSSSFDLPISFAGLGGSTLIWNVATAPTISSAGVPTIAMFAGDTIAFPDLTFTTFDINSGGTVTLLNGATAVSTFMLTGATADLRMVPFSYGGNSGDALVADAEWANAGGGAFGTAANWQDGFVPGTGDIAFIGQGVAAPYTITGGGTVAAMQVAFDTVSLTGSYDLLGSPSSEPAFTPLQVAQGADLSVAATGTVTAPSVLVGPGSSTLDVLGTLTAGSAEVEQGASLLIDGGQISLTGAGGLSLGPIPNELPPAALVISDGGSLTDATAGLALVTGMAAALVTGPASTWTTAGTVYLGSLSSAAATATLTVQNSATVSAADVNLVENGTLDLSPTAHLDGPITTGFGNGGAVNRIGAVADPGQSGTATTTLANAISLNAGDLTLAGGAGTTLDITGSLSGKSFLDVVGDVILANGANSFSAGDGLATELPFAIGGETALGTAGQSGTLEEAATGAFGAGTNTISFAAGSNDTLIVDAGVTATNTLSGFALGDTIDLRGLAFAPGASVNVNGTTVTVASGAASVTLDMVSIEAGARLVASSDGEGATPGTDIAVICFLAGTLIRTPRGDRPVETLAVGDEVLTWGGEVQPLTWIGEGRVLATRGRRTAATPVIVRRGALGENCPAADLRVTKGHGFLIDGALVPVEYLVNHRSIVWDDHAQEVHLYHLELPRHDVLVANGAPAESYRDDGNRWLFANANRGWSQPEKPPYAPVLTGGALVDAAWRRLLMRAGGVRPLPLTADADLHLRADGRRIDGARAADGAWTFRLDSVPAVLRIVSRSGAPDQLGLARDPRELGVALRAITLRQGLVCRRIAAGDARLAEGFHGFEAEGGFRWTDGDALVPGDLLAGLDGPVTLALDVAMTAQYPAIPVLSRAA
jgi:T5SS/PEP-CTERM-associated repeat protein